MERDEVYARVEEIIRDQLVFTETPDLGNADLKDGLGADSLDGMEIVMKVEEAFDITIEDQEATGLRTINQITDFVMKKFQPE